MGELYRFRRLKLAAPKRLRVLPEAVPTRRWLDSLWVPVVAFVLASFAGAALLRIDWDAAPAWIAATAPAAVETATPRHFATCRTRSTPTCVVDGDTFRLDGDIIRIADIDTPEVRDYRCPAEKALGDRATTRLVALLNAGPFTLRRIDRDRDVYGRSLRIVVRDGQSVGGMLVTEGLARAWDGARRGWC